MIAPSTLMRCMAAILLFCHNGTAFLTPFSFRSSLYFTGASSLQSPRTPLTYQPQDAKLGRLGIQSASAFDRLPLAIRRQRRSMGVVQTMGLFGLGAPEIVIILVAAAFLLGPQKLAELGKDAGKIAGELKEVPKEFQKEFQKGLDEGETDARSRKAKKIYELPPELDSSDGDQ